MKSEFTENKNFETFCKNKDSTEIKMNYLQTDMFFSIYSGYSSIPKWKPNYIIENLGSYNV